MIRSFLAIEIPAAQRETVAGFIRELERISSKVKWVSPDQTHLTLKFFGSITPETMDRISLTLAPVVAGFPRFQLSLQGLGGFPNMFRPRVIWLGIRGETESLQGLHRAVEQALEQLGIPREERPFRGHLTLGRNKAPQPNEALYELLSRGVKAETALFDINEVILFRSDLKPAGPVYTRLKVFPLKKEVEA